MASMGHLLPTILLIVCVSVAGCTTHTEPRTNSPPDSQPDSRSTSQSASQSDSQTSELEAYIDGLTTTGASGVALVQIGDEAVVRRGFGSADCAGTEAMGPDHLVMIGSITKEFTRILAYQLAEEGTISFTDPIGKYLPDWPDEKARIPLSSLIHHTSGLPDLVDAHGAPVQYTVEFDYIPVVRNEMLERAAAASLLFQPGAHEEYSNLGYGVLAAILEIASGETYAALLQEKIFGPAGMRHTGYWFENWRDLRFAEGCRGGDERWGSPIVDRMWGDDGPSWNLKGAGGLLSTVDDLSRWLAALRSGTLFGPEMQKRYLADRLVVSERLGQRVMGPAGSNGIVNAVAYWLEQDDLRIAIVTTRADHQAESSGIARELIRRSFTLVESEDQTP